jgi:hypothetical protein
MGWRTMMITPTNSTTIPATQATNPLRDLNKVATNVRAGSKAMSMHEIVSSIELMGHLITLLVQGEMGIGKSALRHLLAARPKFKHHTFIYLDGTTKADSGDLFMIKYGEDGKTFLTVPHEELGLHLEGPVVILIDEIGKMPRSAQLAVLRLAYEREQAGYKLHPDSVVFGTTNLAAEGLGDIMPPHMRDRFTVVEMRKPDNLEFIEYGIERQFAPLLLSWCKQTPQLFHAADMYENGDENKYIAHPLSATSDEAKVTPRSLERASNWINIRHEMTRHMLTSLLYGTIGPQATLDLAAYIELADQIPTREAIMTDPLGAIVPTDSSGVCMIVYRTLATIERSWVSAWMTYLNRLPREAHGLFGNGVREPSYSRLDIVAQNKDYQQWALNNNYLFNTAR